jgi:hypothetical protein
MTSTSSRPLTTSPTLIWLIANYRDTSNTLYSNLQSLLEKDKEKSMIFIFPKKNKRIYHKINPTFRMSLINSWLDLISKTRKSFVISWIKWIVSNYGDRYAMYWESVWLTCPLSRKIRWITYNQLSIVAICPRFLIALPISRVYSAKSVSGIS